MGKKNIRHEMRTEVMRAFSEGADKHSAKRDGRGADKIFSYSTKFVLLDRINDFCRYLPAEVKSLGQLRPEHAQAYLDAKAKAGCTQHTLDEYRSELKKLGAVCRADLAVERRVLADRPLDEHRGAMSVMPKEDFAKILEYAAEHPSKSGLCIQLERHLGVRVSDLAYGVRITGDVLSIQCKNGKVLTRAITPEIKALLQSETGRSMTVGNRFVGVKDNSLNKYLNRVEDKLGLERHSFHDVRRRIAQDKYDECRHGGMTRSDSLSVVSLWLNHGDRRDWMILHSYIYNAW